MIAGLGPADPGSNPGCPILKLKVQKNNEKAL